MPTAGNRVQDGVPTGAVTDDSPQRSRAVVVVDARFSGGKVKITAEAGTTTIR
jgi:hypothetical protein